MNSSQFQNYCLIIEYNNATIVKGPGCVAYPEHVEIILFQSQQQCLSHIVSNNLLYTPNEELE